MSLVAFGIELKVARGHSMPTPEVRYTGTIHQRPRSVALAWTLRTSSKLLGPLLTGVLIQHLGFVMMFVLFAALAAGGAV